MTNFEAAKELVARWEEERSTELKSKHTEIAAAVERFLADANVRGMAASTIKKYRVLLQAPGAGHKDPNRNRPRSIALEEFCADKGLLYIRGLDTDLLREFRGRQLDSPVPAAKKLERLKAFFNFCVASGWIAASPAAGVKPPILKGSAATLPVSEEAVEALRQATPTLRSKQNPHGKAYESDHVDRLAALLRVLEFSGLRISDAVQLSKDDLKDNKLFLFAQEKTKEPVYVPLPQFVVEMLNALPLQKGKYYFWSGEGKWETAAGNYRRTLRELRRLIGQEEIHPHQWRDLCAVRLLEQGVAIEVVSRLLGHRSVAITRKHYSPWVRRLQEQAEEAVAKVWESMGQGAARDSERAAAKLRRVK